MTKHFFKTLLIFTGLILLGITGVILVNYYDEDIKTANTEDTQAQIVE